MKFKEFKLLLKNQFETMIENQDHLFEVEVDKDKMWDLYLESFPAEFNRIFRERREHDCSCCRNFIKNFANVVVIKDNKVTSLWDFDIDDAEFTPSVKALSNYIHSNIVSDVYINKFDKIGTDNNLERLDSGKILEWEHLYLDLPKKFVDKSSYSIGDLKGRYRDSKNVFKRSLDELTQDSVLIILELIQQNSLYKGEEWKGVLTEFLKFKKEYDKLTSDTERNNYAWENSVKVGGAITRIRNHSIGTLLVNISENMDLDLAVRKYEQIVAPSNYKRPKAIYTKKMLEDAKKTIEELGYLDSLSRRYARLDDITVNNILFSNRDSAKKIGGGDIFDEMLSEIPTNPKKFSKVEEVSIDSFVEDILPSATELELYLENKHTSNMVSLIAPEIKDSKTMFKWDNNFSWAYSGNITDSMKERVKSAGGKVDGVLRFSIQWNDDGEHDENDLDAHCIEPCGNRIYFSNKRNYNSTGMLDIDIVNPNKGEPAVENITWSDIRKMKNGTYKFQVHNFTNRGGRGGFRAEIEFNGEVFSFDYAKELKNKEYVDVAEVTLRNGEFTIKKKLPSNVSSKDVWGLKTNKFIPVSVIMNSSNYWDKQEGVGNKHYFFMLKDCINSESPNSFFNEFLKEDLMKHKRVFEALGSKMRVKESDDQLSGVGFSSTKRNDVLVKIKGQTERVIKVKI